MNDYTHLISSTPLVKVVEITTTTGDLDYNGTAIEITTAEGDEFFHVVVDENGEAQFIFFRAEGNYRIPLVEMERIIRVAQREVRWVG